MTQIYYLCLGISLAWGTFFVYAIILDLKLRDIKKRLAARQADCDK